MAIKVSGTEVIDASRNVVNIGTVDGRDIAADGTKLDGIESGADVTDTTNVTAAGALMKTGGTMTGDLILNADPTAPLQAATKEYVDTIAAAGLHYHTPVRVESPVNLNATYDNGTSGVGATLTNAGTLAAITIDGVTLSLNDRVLIYEQTNAAHNGVYTVTTVGDGSTAWVLTRATDADSYGASDPDALGQGDAFFVLEGNTGAGELYVMNTEGSITFGTTGITFTQVAATAVYTAGTGLTLDGTQFNIDGTVLIDSDIGSTVQGYSSVLANTTASYTTAEESKLAGIEAGATGDQTASEILTAIKTVDGSGSGLDADVLDGQQGSYYLDYNNFSNTPSIPSAANNATVTLSAGSGMSGGGAFTTDQSFNETITLSHADTSSQSSVNNSGNTFIQDVTLDTYGHVTGLVSSSVALNDAAITLSAGTGLTGGGNFTTNQGTPETITLNVDTGTTANKIVQLDGSARLPAVDGSQLTNLPGGVLATASTSGASQTVNFGTTDIHVATGNTSTVTFTFSNPDTVDELSLVLESGVAQVGELSNLAYSSELSSVGVLSQNSSDVNGLHFKPDGTELYVASSGQQDINQYTLSTAFDPSTISHTRTLDLSADIPSNEMGNIFFKPDGTKMYVCEGNGPSTYFLNEYALSTAWNISTASYTTQYNANSIFSGYMFNHMNVWFKSDGTVLYLGVWQHGYTYEIPLSTAWDVSSAGTPVQYDFGYQSGGFIFNSSGTKLYVTTGFYDTRQYNLSTAWDISSRTSNEVAEANNSFRNGTLSNNDRFFYTAGYGNLNVYDSAAGPAYVFPASVELETFVPADFEVGKKTIFNFITTDGGTSYQLKSFAKNIS